MTFGEGMTHLFKEVKKPGTILFLLGLFLVLFPGILIIYYFQPSNFTSWDIGLLILMGATYTVALYSITFLSLFYTRIRSLTLENLRTESTVMALGGLAYCAVLTVVAVGGQYLVGARNFHFFIGSYVLLLALACMEQVARLKDKTYKAKSIGMLIILLISLPLSLVAFGVFRMD